MKKYTFLIFTFFVSSCSFGGTQSPDISSVEIFGKQIPTIEVTQIFARDIYFLLYESTNSPQEELDILSDMDRRCIGKDFVSYRRCLLEQLDNHKNILIHNSKQQARFDLFVRSIQDEIRYFPFYREIDESQRFMELRVKRLFSAEELATASGQALLKEIEANKSFINPELCFIAETQPYTVEPWCRECVQQTFFAELSYADGQDKELEKIFPHWKNQKREVRGTWTATGMNSENPCGFRTFGPGVGYILHHFETDSGRYFFIKDASGAGSGEFSYSVFLITKDEKSVIQIASFDMYSVMPFPFGFYDRIDKEILFFKIEDTHRNTPFLYIAYRENELSTLTKVIEDMFLRAIHNK